MGNPVIHWQILSKAPDDTAKFYTQLFGWTVNSDNPLGYRMVSTGTAKGIDGGIWPAPPEANSFVQLHIEVADVAEHVAKAGSLGASGIIPPQTLPQGECMAVMADPQGLPFVIMSRTSKA